MHDHFSFKVVIPSFFNGSYRVWLGYVTQDQVSNDEYMIPGGFHAFDHR